MLLMYEVDLDLLYDGKMFVDENPLTTVSSTLPRSMTDSSFMSASSRSWSGLRPGG